MIASKPPFHTPRSLAAQTMAAARLLMPMPPLCPILGLLLRRGRVHAPTFAAETLSATLATQLVALAASAGTHAQFRRSLLTAPRESTLATAFSTLFCSDSTRCDSLCFRPCSPTTHAFPGYRYYLQSSDTTRSFAVAWAWTQVLSILVLQVCSRAG